MDRFTAALILLSWLSFVTMNAQVPDYIQNFTLLESAVAKGAVCLDGSPPAYAYVEGYGSGSSNWIVYMEGGGWCESLMDCINRSKKYHGSSKYENDTNFVGILDSDSQLNQYFYNWNKVFIHYCDGSVYMSDIKKVDPSNNLTFRGARIYHAMMEEMLHKGMGNAHNAILSGGSAGGLSTILHCDRFRYLFPNTTRVKCISDSGFFIHGEGALANKSGPHFAHVIETHELGALLPKSCTSKRDPNLCLFPEYLIEDVSTPLFLVETAFDSFQIKYSFKPKSIQWGLCELSLEQCNSQQIRIIEEFRPIVLKTLMKLDKSCSRGVFVDSCYLHGHIARRSTWTRSPLVRNTTMEQAIADWYFDRSPFQEIDNNASPQVCPHSDP
ncbi:pectin acetylesterase 11-like [Salvia splendens]|uniref:pectin acetylesterase 11-like n=1 Tax=Salvia splendens TaxID=180675 RepID=UPI001C269E2C|nr:pectin acetylesterase 11-like [Salvia splendens]